MPRKHIDFARLKQALLARAEILVPQWLPGGRRQGHEYLAASTSQGGPGDGLSVNLSTGVWKHFGQDGAAGGDLISLYAHLFTAGDNVAAARALMKEHGLETAAASPGPPPADAPQAPGGARRTVWRAVVPVPEHAPMPTFKHWHYLAPAATYAYRLDGQLFGYVVRFGKRDGGKEILPHTWCVDEGDPRGTHRWRWKQWDAPRPLYLPRGGFSADARPVVLVEGEKCAQALHELLGDEVDVATWPGGCGAWQRADWAWLRGREVVLWPDADSKRGRRTAGPAEGDSAPSNGGEPVQPADLPLLPADAQPGMAAMRGIGALLAASMGCAVRLCPIPAPGTAPDGWDVADAIADGWDAARVREFLASAQPLQADALPAEPGRRPARQRQPGPSALPDARHEAGPTGDADADEYDNDGFALNDSGVWFQGYDQQGRRRPPMRVCGPLRVVARTRLRNGAGWGYLLEVRDPEGNWKEWVISNAAMQGDGVRYREALADLGLSIEPGRIAREKLAHYILSRRVQSFVRLVDRAGWWGRLYVLPGRVFGEAEERMMLAPDAVAEHPFRQRGTSDRWRETIARVCVGNTRLTFAVSAGFAGYLLRLAGMQSGGFLIVGPSSHGKSTVLRAAASVLGSPDMKRSWRSTDNAVEFLAQLHSDSLLLLDELKQCDPRIVGEAVYTLGNGTGRNRAAQRGGLRPTPAWTVLFLSAGELTLEAHMAQAKLQPMEGQRVRMPSIPAEPEGYSGTVFENNHEFDGGAELSRYIERHSALSYGMPGVEFLAAVADRFDDVRDRLRNGIEAFRRLHVPDAADGQLGRIADRFALVAIGGELATEYGVTGWEPGWATAAAVACFHGMVAMRPGGYGSGEEASMLATVRGRIAEHREDWFYDWSRADEKDSHRPNAPRSVGWRRAVTDAAGDVCDTEFYCLPDPFRTMLCEGLEPEKVLQLLDRRGHLVTDKGHFTRAERLPGLGKKRCYRIKSSILEDFGST